MKILHHVKWLAALPFSLLLSYHQVQAQTADTATAYKHHLGLTASPVLDGFFKNNRSLPLGLLYKRQVKPNQAVRARVVGQYSGRDTVSSFAPPIRNIGSYSEGPNTRTWQLMTFVGYEKQFELSKNLNWYMGSDAGVGIGRGAVYSNYRYSYNYNMPGIPNFYTLDINSRSKQYNAQLRPFVGAQTRAVKTVYIFFETAFPLSYQYQQEKIDVREIFLNGEPDRVGQDVRTTHAWNFTWRPVQIIGIIVSFP
ncbi:hypothetical protein [Hymenobacter weizhouensis]|uniref:hypothetical protein n=1 Tax=Hymenobacter sp. YIM 151500-1 TaxID=2987689 RepID=UPI00222641D4|nr:hypothetical protein [Hymenobacter sp. YIM 151500-1]UYZ61962.1 hypothetical protein OIS53_13230 [Hymenobacter sp. YIM 151500-1]